MPFFYKYIGSVSAMALLLAVLLASILSGSAATAWTGPDTLAIVPCGDVSSNEDTLEGDTDCEDQFIETAWDRDHTEWDSDHAGEDDPVGKTEEGDAENRTLFESDVAGDHTNGTDGTSEYGWMGILPPVAGIGLVIMVIVAYRFGKRTGRS
jgi:hypothetical protein